MMNEFVMQLENISDEKFNEMLSACWRLMSVDHFYGEQLIYSFVKS